MLREIGLAKSYNNRHFVGDHNLEGMVEREGPTVLITSIMHTGTHFVMWELFKGWEDRSQKGPGKRGYITMHLAPPDMAKIKTLANQLPTIIPFRHPLAIAQSWKCKGRDICTTMVTMIQNAIGMQDVEPFYLPLDNKTRVARLDMWAARMHMTFNTSWPTVRYDRESEMFKPLNLNEYEVAMGLVSDNRAFFQELGYTC